MADIAVVGATGTIGSRLVARLVQQGHAVRAVSRHAATEAGAAETYAGDLTDPEVARAALEGVAAVYLTPPEGGEEPLELERSVSHNVIRAAVEHGVKHLVVHTALRADRGDTGARVLDNKTPIEREVAEAGIGYTILRPAWFLQNLWAAKGYLEQGVVSLPWPGDMVWAASNVADTVAAAATFLERGPANRGFDLHLPGGITGRQIAEAASEVLGREVSYQEAPVSTREYVESFPISGPHKDIYAELFDYFKSTTYLGEPNALVETLPGFEYHGLRDFLRNELFAEPVTT